MTISHNVTLNSSPTIESLQYTDVGAGNPTFTVQSGVLAITDSYTITRGVTNINAGGKIQVNGLMTITSGIAVVNVYGTLDIEHLTMGGNNTLNVKNTGYITVNQDVDLTNGKITIDEGGFMDVKGDYNTSGGATTTLNGTLNVGQELNFANDSNDITGDGTGSIYYPAISCPAWITNNGHTCEDYLISGVNISTEPLPVTYMYFHATLQSPTVLLEWATATEVNNAYFVIERAGFEGHFVKLAKIPGGGTTSSLQKYQWRDDAPLSGRSYYRIRQVDFDGQNAYTPVVTMNTVQPEKTVLFPNPVAMGESFSLKGAFHREEVVKVTIIGVGGQMLFRKQYLVKENPSLDFNTATIGLAKGMYWVKVVATGSHSVHKLLVR
ncbi:hypothetical protein AAG747_00155 [Rapidithrix thailandica]|uniref:T9SS type A sorting domain-containing protein n=1 Tax=Rapidithrix thailandica TaxID=413964 RepID=A0AAW9RTB8_9BACT